MAQALILKAPSAMTAPGNAPRVVHSLVNGGASRRYLASAAGVVAGAAVTSVPDLAGSGVALVKAAGATAGPTMRASGRLSYMEFDGVDDRMDSQTAGPVLTQPITVLAVGRFRQMPTVTQPLFNLHTNAGGRQLAATSTGYVMGQFSTSVTSTIPVDTNWHVFTLVANGASSVLGKDETEEISNLGTASSASITLGRDGAGTAYGKIDIAELIIWPAALTLSQRQAERASLKLAHGI